MKQYCFINWIGYKKVPDSDKWITTTEGEINRLIYITGGSGGYIADGKKVEFKRNHLYLIPAYPKIHTYSSYESMESRLEHMYVNFELVPLLINSNVIEFDPESDQFVKDALASLFPIVKSTKTYVKNLHEPELSYVKALVIYITNKMLSASSTKILDDTILNDALLEMHKNFSKKISIQDMAAKHYLSCDEFIRRFKKTTGLTPYAYLTNLRIRTAKSLRDSGATLEEAAKKCGYYDANALSHALKKKNKYAVT